MNELITKLLMSNEKDVVEFKNGKDKIPFSLYETYSAFANTKGGTIYLGIQEEDKPPHKIIGVNNAQQKRKQLFDIFNNKQKVSCCLVNEEDVEIISTLEGDIISIYVHEATRQNKPVFINGDLSQSFVRNDSGDHIMSPEKIESLLNDRNEMRYDQRPNKYGITINDLDTESVNEFIKIIKSAGKLSFNDSLDAYGILQRCGGVARDEKTGEYVLNNGAVMFFGKTSDVMTIAPYLWLDYTYSLDNSERWEERVTSKDLSFEGNIFQFYNRAVKKCISNGPSPYLVEGVQDVGKKKVEEMIREAFANAISNIDLFDQTGLVIKQTSKALVLKNAGTMIVPLEDALRGGVSKPRNPALFSFFQAMGTFDHGGYGIPSIYDTSKLLGYLSPQLIEDKEENYTKLVINFRKKDKDLSPNEELVLRIILESKNGLSIFEIVELSNLGRDKVRFIVQTLMSIGLIKDNGKVSKGKKYLSNN